MRIAMISPEAVPFSKTGGLADVAGALPRALAEQGVNVIVVTPFYRTVRAGEKLPVQVFGSDVYQAVLPGSSVKVFFIRRDEYFDRDHLYGTPQGDYPDNCARFSFFCRASLELLRRITFEPHIVHAHDWQSGLVPLYMKSQFDTYFKHARSVFTIHNLAYQGLFDPKEWPLLQLDWKYFNWRELEFYGKINFLKAGIVFADAVTTVSPTYAKEIQTQEYGCGLDGVLRERKSALHGILNGVDYSEWNPKTDKLIPHNYSETSLAGKAKCKEHLQKKMNLPALKDVPLIGMVGRLVEQKGIDLFAKIAEQLTKDRVQFAILGTGNPHYQDVLTKLGRQYPEHFSVRIGFDNPLAHEIEAGSDMFLMPSRYEPCGLNQIYSLKYGTIPIVRKTGGLADTVVDVSTESLSAGAGTGFVFEEYSPQALYGCIQRALAYYRDRAAWKKLVKNAMKQDFSWGRSAREYLRLYQSLAR